MIFTMTFVAHFCEAVCDLLLHDMIVTMYSPGEDSFWVCPNVG